MPDLRNRFANFIHIIIQIKMYDILLRHKMLDWNTLVDQTGCRKRIVRSRYYNDFLLLCRLNHFATDLVSIRNDHTAAVGCDTKKLGFLAISDHDKIIRLKRR